MRQRGRTHGSVLELDLSGGAFVRQKEAVVG